MVHIDFRMLISRAGSEDGARVLFQRMIASLIRIKFKDAREIRPCPGDWGIDVLVGELTGVSMVWQAKYFISGVGEVQKKQIRDSFKTLITKAEENAFIVDLWTLCLPCNLSTDETKWWENWKKKNQKEYNVTIKLMDETAIRSELETPDAQHITRYYFGPDTSIIRRVLEAPKEQPERALECLPDRAMYEEALFIKKLKAGGASEISSAKTAFFNAELLTQEVVDKGDSAEINSIQNLKLKLRSMWETRFNELFTDKSPNLKHLFPGLMKDIEKQDTTSLRSPEISATFLHKQGMVHQMANKCEVGWTKNFRDEFGEG